jgi:hypothetical protein
MLIKPERSERFEDKFRFRQNIAIFYRPLCIYPTAKRPGELTISWKEGEVEKQVREEEKVLHPRQTFPQAPPDRADKLYLQPRQTSFTHNPCKQALLA